MFGLLRKREEHKSVACASCGGVPFVAQSAWNSEAAGRVFTNSQRVCLSADRRKENTMLENTNPFDDEMEKQTVPGDAAELSTHSRWDDFSSR
jgi:hypothetical protein